MSWANSVFTQPRVACTQQFGCYLRRTCRFLDEALVSSLRPVLCHHIGDVPYFPHGLPVLPWGRTCHVFLLSSVLTERTGQPEPCSTETNRRHSRASIARSLHEGASMCVSRVIFFFVFPLSHLEFKGSLIVNASPSRVPSSSSLDGHHLVRYVSSLSCCFRMNCKLNHRV